MDQYVNSAAFLDLPPLDIVFGLTPAMQAIRQKLERVAITDVPVLLQGETGTGKEICARLLHAFSCRSKDSLVKVNCPSIPQTLLETELFGYEKGAFTGAHSTKRGRIEQAHGGTLFLDEVGSLDLMVQSKLLQILQDGTFVRVGGHTTLSIETRLISVANRDLRSQVEDGTFRLDFLYRINAVTINLLPLRSRNSTPATASWMTSISVSLSPCGTLQRRRRSIWSAILFLRLSRPIAGIARRPQSGCTLAIAPCCTS